MTRTAAALALGLVIGALVLGGTASAILLVTALVPAGYLVYRQVRADASSKDSTGGGDGTPPGIGLPF